MSKLLRSNTGSVTVVVLVVIDLILFGLAGYLAWTKHNPATKPAKNSATTQTSSTTQSATNSTNMSSSNMSMASSLQMASRNTQRKDDASMLLGTIEEYINNNLGQLPTGIDGGQIHGDQANDNPSTMPTLSLYRSASLVSGPQAALDHDALIVVTEAACGQDGATLGGTNREVVVQYTVEQSDGSFKGACLSD
jgi:hypothetical protein